MNVRLVGLIVALMLATALFLAPVNAQTSNGTIAGTVTDLSGGAISGAKVTVTSIDRGSDSRTATTDASGTYRVGSLIPGRYRVSVQASGFAIMTVNDVEVRGSLESSANVVLEVSSISASVTIEASASQELQTQTGALSGNISTAEVHNLPYGLTGNPIELLRTEAGVQNVAKRDDLTNGVSFSVNGTRPRANNFLIDGQDNNDSQIAGQAVQTINHEAISEVTILTNSASAEFGRGGGSVTNEIFKGGTNNWHGSAWEINQPSKLSAIPADLALGGITRNPVQITNTFGFSVGGPAVKNKLFFFGTPQWNRFRANAGANAHVLLLPTANGVAALQQIEATEGPNANIDYLLAALGNIRGTSEGRRTFSAGVAPNGTPRPAIEFGNVLRGDTSILLNDLQWDFRVDYIASDHDTLTARYFHDNLTLTPDFFNNPDELPNFETQQGGPSSNFHAAWAHTINSRMINELRFSYATINFGFEPTAATLNSPIGTHFTVRLNDITNPSDGANTFFGLPANEPAFRDHQTYQFQDGFSWSFGRHSLKFGGDVALVFVSDGIPVDTRGTLTVFRGGTCGTTTCSALANYIDNFSGRGGTVTRFFGNTNIHPFAPNYAPYVQDTWRIRPNFTLDLGLRYEYWGTPENVLQFPALAANIHQGLAGATFPGSFTAPEQANKKNFAPRAGLAYTPHFWNRIFGGDRTVFRAGYGIFYDGLFTNILDNTAGGSPNGVLQNQTGPNQGRGFGNATGVLVGLQPTLNKLSTVTTIVANLRNPLTHQWNVDIQRQLPGGLLVTAAYVGTRGEHLFANQEFNPGRANPNFGFVSARTNGGDSIYHAGQLTVEHPFKHGLLVRGAYTYSKFIDDVSEVFVTSGLSSRAQNLSNQSADRGLSAFDRRHRLAIAYLYDLPAVQSRDNALFTVLNAITNGWQTSGTVAFTTGAPQTINDGFDNNGDGYAQDRPSLGNPKIPINYSTACLDPASTCDSGVGFSTDGVHFVDFNSSFGLDALGNPVATKNDFRYIVVAGQNGNVGRNTFISPGTIDTNLSVQRTVKFKERYAFMLRGEFYNAFNHPNLGIPSGNLASAAFANLAQTINGGRTVILWGKFSF